ncbi:hypothetical protein LQN65_003692 [Salmonella enterica]|nr:hypothetical protein [Salmonella enterica]
MFRVTCIDLENGEFALYINGHYLSSEDGSGEKLYLGDILERLSRLPGVTTETVERPVPDSDEWSWNDVADSDFLALDSSLTEDDIDAAMELAQHCHDANDGFNWSHLQWAIDEVKRGG